MTIKPKIRFRLRVASVALALALGWISVPLALASWELDVCEKECCIAEGYCCCATRHAYVKGREPKSGEILLNFQTSLTKSCSAALGGSRISAKNNLFHAAHLQVPFVSLASILLPNYRDRISLDHQFAGKPYSPRAPPVVNRSIA
jgi:hypothetical protein